MSALDKKIKSLREALPRLDEAEARRLLEKAGGSVNKASDMALEDGEWTNAASKKKPVPKKDKPAAPERREDNKDRPRRDFADRKPRFEEPKAAKKVEVKSTPSTIVVGGSKSKVETGISFADMIKRQKQTEQPAEVAPEPEVVIEAPTQETAVAPEEPEVTPAPVAEVPKPKREKKEVKKKVAPLPQKYVAEIDRAETVTLPPNIVELASGAFTFTSEPGRAPTPPRQVQPIHQQPQQQQIGQQNDWSHNAPRHPQQQPVQRTWNQDGGNNYNRNQHFTGEWRQPQQRNYDNNMGYNHRMNPQQQSYRGYDNTNNHVARPPAGQQPQTNNFW